jgi:hypothetical protein
MKAKYALHTISFSITYYYGSSSGNRAIEILFFILIVPILNAFLQGMPSRSKSHQNRNGYHTKWVFCMISCILDTKTTIDHVVEGIRSIRTKPVIK